MEKEMMFDQAVIDKCVLPKWKFFLTSLIFWKWKRVKIQNETILMRKQ